MSLENTNSSPITRQTLDHVQEENDYDLPLSREAKSPAYPDGPVCIYEPFVYLYLEPTESEASEFDVVLNVAREVQNPFSTGTERTGFTHLEDAAVQIPLDSRSSFFAGRRSVSEPQTAISDKSFRASFETQLEDLARQSHETPKAPTTTPEYIHVPWDHNTNVVDDLLRLCEVIDDRVQQQKRVLVHCQCGVSRSASLVVAYGLFKNPRLSVQDAYNVVKDHSRWIGPNMNLIYQLSEFKSNLARRAISGAPSWHPWRGTGSEAFSSNTISVAGSSSLVSLAPFHGSHEEPTSTTHQIDRESQQRANSLGTSKSSHIIDASAGGDVTPGPASAPPDMIWSPSAEDGEPKEDPTAAAIEDHRPDFSAEPKPMEADSNDASQIDQCLPPLTASFEPGIHEAITQPVSSPPQILPAGFSSLSARRNGPHKLSLRQELPMFTSMQIPRGGLDHAMLDDVPQSPSLLSPRAAEFTASPFHRTVAGDLAGSSVFEQALMSPKPQDDDPRSPAQRGEAPITRSIFDML